MSKWPIVALGDICELVGGGTPSRQVPEYFGGEIPWITPTDVTKLNGRYLHKGREGITESGLAKSSAKLLPPNSVLLTSRATIGFTAINTAPVSTNQGFANFICSKQILPEYLAHVLEWMRDDLISQASGATFKEISKSSLKRIGIPLPPVGEQRRIVALLDRAADIRKRAEAGRVKARAIIPALFVDLFGDPATNPMGWDVVELGDVLDSAQYGTSQKANEAGQGVPTIRMGNVTASGELDTSNLKHIALEGKEYLNAELRAGDILFNRTNSKELVGKTGLWDGRFEAVAASYFIRLRVNREKMTPEYVWCFMNTPHMKKVLFNTARGAIGQSNINAKELRSFRLPLPTKELQDRFAADLQTVEALVERCGKGLEMASATQTALSAEVFG